MTTRPQAPAPGAARRARGFTLVELMVVIVILGGLIAIVGPNVFRALSESDFQRAESQMANFESAIKMYYMSHRKLPSSLEELTEEDPRSGEAYLDKVPMDPWGNPYDYKVLSGKNYKIVSYGQDAQEGTEDDVVWPKDEE